MFSYFKSTESKSRINFLEILRGKYTDYVVSDECLDYMFDHGASDELLNLLEDASRKYFANLTKWIKHLSRLGIVFNKEQRVATEGALIGSLFSQGFHDELVIVSDDAPQFALFLNTLCWIHAERHFRKFIPVADQIRLELEQVCDAIWNLYHELKEYKRVPKAQQKEAQEARGVLPVEELEKPLQVLRKPVVSKKYHFGNTCKAGWVVLEKSLHLLPL